MEEAIIEIKRLGNACFKIQGNEKTVYVDPYDLKQHDKASYNIQKKDMVATRANIITNPHLHISYHLIFILIPLNVIFPKIPIGTINRITFLSYG